MFPTPDADDLQADFLEYRNTLRRKCTLRTCCSCGENHSLDDMVLDQSKKDAEALDFAGSSVFPPIAGFVFLQNPSGQSGLHICLRCFPDLKRGKRPHRAYHFGTPDPQLSCLNPHELRLVKPLVQVYQLRRLFGAGGSVQYGMTGIVASFENDSARVAARLPRLPSQSSTAYLVRKSAHTGLPLRELIRPELVRTAVMWACGVDSDGQAAATGCPHIGFQGIKWDPDAADTIQRACDDPSTEPGEQPVVVEQDEEEGEEEETPSGGHHDAVLIPTREGGRWTL